MRHHIVTAVALAAATPALGFSCGFETECYEAEPCRASDFTAEVDIDASRISTGFGDLEIVAVKQGETAIVIFATGGQTEFLMTVAPDAARLTAQVNDGPQVISYLGTCEGVF